MKVGDKLWTCNEDFDDGICRPWELVVKIFIGDYDYNIVLSRNIDS